MKKSSLRVIVPIVISLAFSPAKAQDKLPVIDALNKEEVTNLPLSQGFSNYQSNNLYLEDTLKLQYQISLLEKMIERQGNIARLEKSYMDLGLPFDQPIPPRGICEQIPANIPCHRAHPDLYNIILPEVGQLDMLIEEPLSVDMIVSGTQASQESKKQEALAPDPVEEPKLAENYNWTEVLCGGGVCSAVIIKDNDSTLRRTVQEGDTLEDGKISVKSITATGVILSEGGQDVALKPAIDPFGGVISPILSGGTTTPSVPEKSAYNEGDIVTQDLVPVSAVKSPPKPKIEEYKKAVEENEAIVDPGPPPLGPTGLF